MSKQKPAENYDICIHGQSKDSFQKAVRHAMAGKHVALVHEKDADDRDFSSKEQIILQALYASAQNAHYFRIADRFGLKSALPDIDWPNIQKHIADSLQKIAPHYSMERLKALGVHVIQGPVQDEIITARTILHEDRPVFANPFESHNNIQSLSLTGITNWQNLPEHLTILGDGPMAVSLAQSLLRLGCKTTIVASGDILQGLDRELYKILFDRFEYEGIRLIQNADITKIDQAEKVIVHMVHEEAKRRVSGSHILALNEERQENIYALSDPAIAQIGLTEEQARETLGAGNFHLIKWRYQECDFACSMQKTDGLMKIITKTNGSVIGAGICGEAAQELIMPWALAMNNNLKIADMKDLHSSYSAYSRMSTLSIDGYMSQIANPARLFKNPGSFWQSLIGGGG